MRTDTDVAWCAGFFDGEGHVSYRRSCPNPKTGKVSPSLQCAIPQATANKEVLDFFQSVIGFGTIRGPYPMPGGKPQHVLTFGVKEVEELLKILAPYLKSEKLADFHVALMKYWSHDPKATDEDHARATKHSQKKGCPKCGNVEKWNTVMCYECGYM